MKKLIVLFFSICVLFSNVYSHTVLKNSVPSKFINVIIDGETFPGASIYKVSEQIYYFSIKEISEIYNAALEWQPVSSKVTMHLNNRKIDIKAGSMEVTFGGKAKKMSLPPRLIKNNIYIPSEILTSKEFSEIAKANTSWNPSSSVLNITHYLNISAVRYFTRPESTQVLIELEEPLSYMVLKTSASVVVKILRGKVQHDCINANNGVIKSIVCDMQGRSALIAINLTQKPEFVKVSNLSKPNRISVDIMHSKNIDISNSKETVISKPEGEYALNDSVQEFDLTPPEQYGQAQISEFISFVEKDTDNKDLEKIPVTKFENKNIIDVSSAITDDPAMTSGIIPKRQNQKKHNKRKKIIVLDAGHGGKDPGAVGPNGTKEKDINLEIVYELKKIFDNDNNYEIILTRKDDTFIPLAERTNIANEHNADLFISIHCNANFDRSINGFEIYFLSEKATDSEAAATAVLENSVLKLEGKPSKKRTLLENMLRSMVINEYINDSSELGGFIASQIPSRVKIPNNGVKQASFYVLRGTQMPAVFIESAFISNYAQEAKFRSKKFRTAIADSIYEGIAKYYARKEKK
ncbi:MAG: N-acetylmuramoyl-L-alanine amidase [Endomicrobium sp.]|jgi:N-acetylmuramoyl-L-alanine amidase|nr:N-acetylmuramoyl-L-alanine amidase [Endomicrobium sp.]